MRDYTSRSIGVNNLCELCVDKAVSSGEILGGANGSAILRTALMLSSKCLRWILDKNNKAMVFYTTLFNHSIGTLKQQTLITDIIYMYTYPHTIPLPNTYETTCWYVGLRTWCWVASDACPAKLTPTFAWLEIIRHYSGVAVPFASHHSHNPQLHLLALPWSIFLAFTPLLLPPLEPRLLLQHLEFPLYVPHLMHWHLKL